MCLGGPDFECGEGHTGRLCALPDMGYALQSGAAFECPGGFGSTASFFATVAMIGAV